MIKNIQNKLAEKDLDALLLTGMVNRRYATGFFSSDGMALITRDSAFFLTDSRYIEAAQKNVRGFSAVIKAANRGEYDEKINALISEHNIMRLGVEDEILSYSEFVRLDEKLNAKLIPAQSVMSELRMVKSEDEIEKLKAAQELAEKAYDKILGIIRPGITEKELAAELVYTILRLGADNISFDPIVVAGTKTSMPHGVPGDVKITAGSFVTMDFGCRLDGYCSDMTRTVALGNASDEMKKVYSTVLDAQLAGIEKAKAGVLGCDIDSAARELIDSRGFGGFFGHGFGHGLGIEVHEPPRAAQTYKLEVPEGSVISAEPGIYIPGKFGVRIEDVIVIRKNGTENLMKSPKELIIL